MNRAVQNLELKMFIRSKDEISKKQDDALVDSDFGREIGTKKLGLHWIQLLPKQRSSFPHAESLEEEFIYIVKGKPHLWLNGYLYELEPGMAIGFAPGTGVAHCLLNNTDEIIEFIALGDRTKKENKCSFPVNPELQATHKEIWWADYPSQSFGPHGGSIGVLDHVRPTQQLSTAKNVYTLERKLGFSYPGDNEKFTHGVRLTDQLGMKSVGVWHEILKKGKRSSWPHAHKLEEEFAIITKGQPRVWLNGFSYQLKPGDCVFFKPGTNIAHVLINDGDEDVEYLGGGQADDGGPDEKICYPLHATRNEQCAGSGYLWQDTPPMNLDPDKAALPKLTDVEIIESKDPDFFLKQLGHILYEKEAEYSLMLGLCELKASGQSQTPDYYYFLVKQADTFIGGAVVTEKSLVLSMMPEPTLVPLVNALQEKCIKCPGVVGPAITADSFSRIWADGKQTERKLSMAQKIYALQDVKLSENVSGSFCAANENHIELVAEWLVKFTEESLPNEISTIENARAFVTAKIKKNEILLWLDSTGTPVSMNFVGRPNKSGTSVSGVFTPKSKRANGFASAVVAHTSKKMLDKGKKFCVLYTDLANPTSNKIYQTIGYKEVATSKHFLLKE